jgi:4-hydroxy-tetrahydrodipicolinate reductase
MTSVYLNGDGRMGASLLALIEDADPAAAGLSLCPSAAEADVVLDYSHPIATEALLAELGPLGKPLLVGTTGLPDELVAKLRALSERCPVVLAPNTGTGIAVLAGLVRNAVAALGPGWDIEVLEMHHRDKVDSPSGTAWMLLERAAGDGRDRAVPARVGEVGARSDAEIGVQSLRGGDVVGEHTVYLVGQGERIELIHRCWDRLTFARGGLRVARWLCEADRQPGLYTMADVLAAGEGSATS